MLDMAKKSKNIEVNSSCLLPRCSDMHCLAFADLDYKKAPAAVIFLLQYCLGSQDNLATVLFAFIKNTLAFSRICQVHAVGNNHLRGKIAIFDKFEQLRQELMHMGLPHFKG